MNDNQFLTIVSVTTLSLNLSVPEAANISRADGPVIVRVMRSKEDDAQGVK